MRIRLELYKAGWIAFQESPFIGHGWAQLMADGAKAEARKAWLEARGLYRKAVKRAKDSEGMPSTSTTSEKPCASLYEAATAPLNRSAHQTTS
mgnify:CR=1 FL=1